MPISVSPPGGLKFGVVSYTGDGTASKVIALPFSPRMLFIVILGGNQNLVPLAVDFAAQTWAYSATAGALPEDDDTNHAGTFRSAFPSNTQVDVGWFNANTLFNFFNLAATSYRIYLFA